MNFLSTNDSSRRASLKDAILNSLPPDRGLYLPVSMPPFPEEFWHDFYQLSFAEIGFRAAKHWLGNTVPDEVLRPMVADTLSFDAPLLEVSPGIHVLELFHGPTLAFKDFGARFMARLMAWLTRDDSRPLRVLVATSGDTGGAVAHAFHGVPGVEVVILYPSGMVSPLQEKQLTTLGENITALEISGSFDDCQALVKQAFVDPDLQLNCQLTSANSINLARLIPQSFYYLRALQQLPDNTQPIFVVPSGNLGNLCAGVLAARAGMPAAKFIAASNDNRVIPDYLSSGHYAAAPTKATIANAMDVGNPSNLPRLQAFFKGNFDEIKALVSGDSYSDDQIRSAIQEVHAKHHYLLDPHTAIAWLAAKADASPHPKIILATAHPSKFIETMEAILGPDVVETPERLACLAHLEKESIPLSSKFEDFKKYLLQRDLDSIRN